MFLLIIIAKKSLLVYKADSDSPSREVFSLIIPVASTDMEYITCSESDGDSESLRESVRFCRTVSLGENTVKRINKIGNGSRF